MILIKLFLLISLLFVLIQDVKQREVYWFLFPVIAGLVAYLHYKEAIAPELFFSAIAINSLFVSILVFILFIYSKYKLKLQLNETFGLGDVLIFFALAFSFSTVSFLIIFIASLVFALVLHLTLKKKSSFSTVPLAGYISLFFGISFLGHWLGCLNMVYSI